MLETEETHGEIIQGTSLLMFNVTLLTNEPIYVFLKVAWHWFVGGKCRRSRLRRGRGKEGRLRDQQLGCATVLMLPSVVTASLVPLKRSTCAEDIRLCFGSFADRRTQKLHWHCSGLVSS